MSPLVRMAVLVTAGCLLACSDRATTQAPAAPAAAEFDGARAFRDLEALVKLGPRPAGSAAAGQARELLRDRLRQAGWRVETHDFQVPRRGSAPVAMENLIARHGAGPARTLVITHYDTKHIAGIEFVGANDGASGAAVLLELARVTSGDPRTAGVELVFFDGEEAFGANIDQDDGLYGSKALAQRMADDGSLAQVQAVVLVDMVGDRDLNLALDFRSSPELRQAYESAAAKLGQAPPFDPGQAMGVIDDHTPFQEHGVAQSLALIDFQYGSRKSPGPRWHTAGDTLEAVSAESLAAVGKPLVELLRERGAGAGSAP
ncbi:MAG TPA: M28 family peptidase [Myxococcota bacterium]|nr:M28 family peptidase [Myxococcota bacterium]